jgi:long-chain acyl-CoA synthetase
MSEAAAAAKPWPVCSIAQAHALLTRETSPFEMAETEVRGIKTRIWKNAPPTLREAFLAGRAHGAKTFMVYEHQRVSFEDVARASLAIAEALKAKGVVKGDRVAIAMRNLPEWPAALFGTLLLGAIATPLNSWWTGAELEHGLTDSGAKIAIVDSERLERISEHLQNCPALEHMFVTRHEEELGHPITSRLEDITKTASHWNELPDRPLPQVDIGIDDDAMILYTSGTTGKPKGALGTHRNACSNIVGAAFSAYRSYIRRGEAPPAPDPEAPQKSTLLSIPFFHTTGCHAVLLPSWALGFKLVLMRRWDAEVAMQLIEREKCTSAGGVPTIAWQLIENEARQKYDLSSLESVSYGGAPASAELVRRIVGTFPKSAPGIGWGMTETTATFTQHNGEDYENRPESAGPALPVCEMKIVGANGETLGPNEIGELWAKGPNVVKGYWHNPKATAETFIDGWLRTGDVGKMDEEGFLFILDRKKDMLIRGGENIYCVEVESVLYEHPAIMDAAVVGLAHRTLGEEPGAVVTLKPGASVSEQEIRAFVAERLAAFKVPVRVVAVHETLPRNANGKILKNQLKILFEDAASA